MQYFYAKIHFFEDKTSILLHFFEDKISDLLHFFDDKTILLTEKTHDDILFISYVSCDTSLLGVSVTQ